MQCEAECKLRRVEYARGMYLQSMKGPRPVLSQLIAEIDAGGGHHWVAALLLLLVLLDNCRGPWSAMNVLVTSNLRHVSSIAMSLVKWCFHAFDI